MCFHIFQDWKIAVQFRLIGTAGGLQCNLLPKAGQLWDQARLLRSLFSRVFKASKDGDITVSLDSLLHCMALFRRKSYHYLSHVYQLPLLQLQHTLSKHFVKLIPQKIIHRSTKTSNVYPFKSKPSRKKIAAENILLWSYCHQKKSELHLEFRKIYILVFFIFPCHITFSHCTIGHLCTPFTEYNETKKCKAITVQ